MRSLQGYIAKNLETLMESRLLDDLPYDVIKALSAYIRTQQTLKAPFVRNGGNLDVLMARWSAWFEMQDIPITIIPRTGPLPIKAAQSKISPPIPGLSPPSNPGPITPALSTVPLHPPTANSPTMALLKRKPSAVRDPDDGVFAMDDDPPPIVQPAIIPSDAARSSPWKSKTTEKVDMKAIIALAEEEQRLRVPARRGDSDASDSSPSKWVVNRGQQQREKGRPSVGPSIESSASISRHGPAENLMKNAVLSTPMKPHALPSVASNSVTRPSDSPWRSSEPQTRPQGSSGPSAFPALSETTPAQDQKRSNMNQAGSTQGPLFTPTKTSSSSTIKRRTSS